MRSQVVNESTNTQRLRNELPKCYPFVKWAGGKNQLLSSLDPLIPKKFTTYFEPFLGGGAVFFYLLSEKNLRFKAFLSDINEELINAFNIIKNDVEKLITILENHQRMYDRSPQDYYYKLRAQTKSFDRVESAGRFIALNKTCYNGLYRVNSKGVFNVPMGRYKNPLICDSSNLRKISIILKNSNTHFESIDYRAILETKTREGDFVYLDPPYNPINPTSNFTSYTNNKFSEKDQIELSEIFNKLHDRKCNILLSNSDTPLIRKLYHDFSDYTISVKALRAINSKGFKRTGHRELLIKNYP
jgi:DNA adenine methylase